MSKTGARILLLSAYDAASHRHWCQWLQSTFTDYHWTCLSLPDRHFYWRVRSNALTFLSKYSDVLTAPYDLIIATSMTDLATLKGFIPALSRCPSLVYFHENQFAYPQQNDQRHKSNLINAQLNSVLTATAADRLVFNSVYNRTSFSQGLRAFIKRMPDGIDRQLPDILDARSQVLPVPIISTPCRPGSDNDKHMPEIVWNHRWEYDKQPEVFFAALTKLHDEQLPFKLHVMGQTFRESPACFAVAQEYLRDRIITWGYQSRQHYDEVLRRADVVVSTAIHDFQGLGMLEAMHRGCIPVAPDRMAYPEYIPASLRYGIDDEVNALCGLLRKLITGPRPPTPDIDAYLDTTLHSRYKVLIEQALHSTAPEAAQ